MDTASIPRGTKAELIAISLGSAAHRDIIDAFEEKLDRKVARTAGEREYARYVQMELEGIPYQDTREWYEKPYYPEGVADDALVEFYNVLWIEREGDVVFRKAAGRVLKTAWDENCSGPVEINLV